MVELKPLHMQTLEELEKNLAAYRDSLEKLKGEEQKKTVRLLLNYEGLKDIYEKWIELYEREIQKRSKV